MARIFRDCRHLEDFHGASRGRAGTGKPPGRRAGSEYLFNSCLRDGRVPTSALPVLKNGLTLAGLADQAIEKPVIVKGRLVVGCGNGWGSLWYFPKPEVNQDGFNDLGVLDKTDDVHGRATVGTHQGVHFENLLNEPSPILAAGLAEFLLLSVTAR